jgi:hypothetical protein
LASKKDSNTEEKGGGTENTEKGRMARRSTKALLMASDLLRSIIRAMSAR